MKNNFKKAVSSQRPRAMEEEMLRQAIDKMFVNAEEQKEERYGLHASAIIASDSEFCIREQVLSLFYKMNQGKELPIGTRKIFHHGNTIHEEIYDVFRKSGVLIDSEKTRYIEKYDLSFTIDANVHILNKDWICDVKSMNGYAFDKAASHPSGEKQVLFYLWLYKKKQGFVLAYNKNTSEIKIFIVDYDKEKVRPFVDRLKEIREAKIIYEEEGTLPKRKCNSSDCKRASTCNMRDACYNIGIGRVKLDASLKRKRQKESLES